MPFHGDLPDDCPPDEVEDGELTGVFRVLAGGAPVAYDWLTHAERNEQPCPAGVSLCRWWSLSLTRNLEKSKKLPNFRNATHAAELRIPAGSGVHKSKKHHVDYWRLESVDLATLVVNVRPL